MGKLYDGTAVVEEFHSPQPPSSTTVIQVWRDPPVATLANPVDGSRNNQNQSIPETDWDSVNGLEEQQRKSMKRLSSRGVYWKHPSEPISALFYLFHGGDVEADGNCLFSASQKIIGSSHGPRDLRRRTVERFLASYEARSCRDREDIDRAIKHLYAPDLQAGWGVHVVQELKVLATKADRHALDASIAHLVEFGLHREAAAAEIYKERCIAVEDGLSWAKYMSVMGASDDEHDIITLQYTQEGLLTVDENREGRAAAFGDDIAIESLATEFKREIFVVQAHGFDAMIEDDNCVFFLPHRPRGQICCPPVFLFMKGTGWCGAGGDHYEPLIAYSAPVVSPEKAAVVL